MEQWCSETTSIYDISYMKSGSITLSIYAVRVVKKLNLVNYADAMTSEG